MSSSMAARTAGLGKRILPGQLWGAPPSSATGSPSIDGGTGDLIGLTVELYLGSLGWTDITPWVYYRDGTTKIPITRGRGDETSQTPPQSAALVLNNRDGRFSPRNPTGPYYGLLTRNTPIRISRLNNGVRRYRGYFEVPSWPVSSDISGKDVVVTLTPAGMLRRLGQGNKPLRSPMFRAYTISYSLLNFAIYATPPPVAYWPGEDGTSSTQIASGLSSGAAMTFTGLPTFANNSAFPGSAALPLLNGSTWTGAVPTAATTANVLRLLISIPSTGAANNGVIARLFTAGGAARVEVVYTTASSGSLTLNGYSSNGTSLFSTSPITGVNAAPGIATVELTPDPTPGTVDCSLFFAAIGSAVVATVTGSFLGSVGSATQVVINPGGSITDTAVGHVAVQATALTNISDAAASAMTAWIGESPVIRFLRLCGEQGVPAYAQFIISSATNPGDETTMGYQTTDTFTTLLQQVADTSFLPVYEARDQLSLTLRSKGTMYNQAAKLTLDMTQHQLSAALKPVDDDSFTRNDVTVTRNGGSSYEAMLTSGSMSTQAPPNGVGPYDTEYPISLGDDSLLPDQAGWRLRFGTVDEPRYPQISLNLRHPQFTTNVDLLNAALTIDVGDVLVIKNPTVPNYPPDDIRLVVQGYTEVLGTFEHDMVINCTPEAPWRVGITDDAVLGHADTDGSTLAGSYPLGTEPSLLVATTNPASPLWTTSAGDFPFDIAVGGERMTVTNITGGSSPQTFTVTRSVNTVVKVQTFGTDVRLWQPSYTSL